MTKLRIDELREYDKKEDTEEDTDQLLQSAIVAAQSLEKECIVLMLRIY